MAKLDNKVTTVTEYTITLTAHEALAIRCVLGNSQHNKVREYALNLNFSTQEADEAGLAFNELYKFFKRTLGN